MDVQLLAIKVLQVLPVTLTLRSDTVGVGVDYSARLTDQYGFFTVEVGILPCGTYEWRADDASYTQHFPNYLANSGTVGLAGDDVTRMEMGLMRVEAPTTTTW